MSAKSISRSELCKREGIKHRRQYTKVLKLQIKELKYSKKQLEIENKKLKQELISLTSSFPTAAKAAFSSLSTSQQSIADNTTDIISLSTLFFRNLS